VIFAGGENRSSDYRLFLPPYICPGLPRPTIVSVNHGNPSLSYGQVFTVRFTTPPGTTVDRVVLMRPSSVTHHTDYDQRYVQLESTGSSETPEEVEVSTPPYKPGLAPGPPDPNQLSCLPGYYMLAVVTNGGTPSHAAWVELR
jgi:hypothetical protein